MPGGLRLSLSKVAFRGAAKSDHDHMRPLSGIRKLSYGWVLVFTLALTETTSWGILY